MKKTIILLIMTLLFFIIIKNNLFCYRPNLNVSIDYFKSLNTDKNTEKMFKNIIIKSITSDRNAGVLNDAINNNENVKFYIRSQIRHHEKYYDLFVFAKYLDSKLVTFFDIDDLKLSLNKLESTIPKDVKGIKIMINHVNIWTNYDNVQYFGFTCDVIYNSRDKYKIKHKIDSIKIDRCQLDEIRNKVFMSIFEDVVEFIKIYELKNNNITAVDKIIQINNEHRKHPYFKRIDDTYYCKLQKSRLITVYKSNFKNMSMLNIIFNNRKIKKFIKSYYKLEGDVTIEDVSILIIYCLGNDDNGWDIKIKNPNSEIYVFYKNKKVKIQKKDPFL